MSLILNLDGAPGKNEDPILSLLRAMSGAALQSAIPNLSAALAAYRAPRAHIPIVAAVKGGGSCYLASFTRIYMDGAADELGSAKSALLRLFAPGVSIGGYAARAMGMDDIVTVNNNLHPTCHVGDWRGLNVHDMTAALIAHYPRDAIWVRGLNDRFHGGELSRLKAAGYIVAPSRPVDIFDSTGSGWKITRHLREDLNKLNRLPGLTPFAGGQLAKADFVTMERLSRSATVERHGNLMPHYKAPFFQACASWPDCLLVGLRDGRGRLRGFATIIQGADRLTCGTLGYDLADERARLIYPALMAMTMNEAIKTKRPFNIGYGAADFKRRRGTSQAMEMNAFYVGHLPAARRSLWQAVTAAMATLAGPVMKRL